MSTNQADDCVLHHILQRLNIGGDYTGSRFVYLGQVVNQHPTPLQILYCRWRSVYQEGRVGIPFTEKEGLGSHLPRRTGWDPIYQEGMVGIPFTKKEGLGSHLPRRKGYNPNYQRKGWDPIYQEGRDGIPFTDLTSPHVCVCPKSGTGFPTSYVFIVFSEFI